MPSKSTLTTARTAPTALRVGFIALTDAAPLIVAREMGLFRREGVRVELRRELGWATIRDKVIYRELDAAHALGALVLSTSLGIHCPACPCLTAFALGEEGNAITLSTELHERGVHDGATLRDEARRLRGNRPLVFGVVSEYSSHRILLGDWLKSAGLRPDVDYRIVVVPPPLLFRNLYAGTIDGYCSGEPWNALAVREQAGFCPATSRTLAPGHVEKVLMVREDFAESRDAEHRALLRALASASELCTRPEFRSELVSLLARREYLNLSAKVVELGLGATEAPMFPILHGTNVHEPSADKALWLLEGFHRHGLIPASLPVPDDLVERTFRVDLFEQTFGVSSAQSAGAR